MKWRCGVCGKVHDTETKPMRCEECGNSARFYALKEVGSKWLQK